MPDAPSAYTPDQTPGTVLDGLKIVLPSGGIFPLAHEMEVELMRSRIERYLNDNHFSNISDLADLDSIVIHEMFIFRWEHWCSLGEDYHGADIAESSLRKTIGDYSRENRQLKAQLGVDKTSRDRARGEDSIVDFIRLLPMRAREFGIHRDEQVAMVYELGMELVGVLTLYDNADEHERREMHITQPELFDWIRVVFKSRLEKLDAAFRLNQRMWIRDL